MRRSSSTAPVAGSSSPPGASDGAAPSVRPASTPSPSPPPTGRPDPARSPDHVRRHLRSPRRAARLAVCPEQRLRAGDLHDRRHRDAARDAAQPEEHQGHARDAAPGPRDAQAPERAPQRPPEAQRRDDEALPGAQGQPDGLVPADRGADAGVHHHVPDPARHDLRAVGWQRGHRPSGARRRRRHRPDRLHAPLPVAHLRALRVAGPRRAHDLVRARSVGVTGRDAR